MAVHRLKKLFCCLFIAVSTAPAFCQEQPKDDSKEESSVSIRLTAEPLYLFIRTAKAAAEIKKPDSRLAYIISPELYFGSVYDKEFLQFKRKPADNLSGFGISFQQKLYGKEKQHGSYFAWNIAYRHPVINYFTEGFIPYEKDELKYYEYGPYSKNLKIHNFTGSILGGIQAHSKSNLLFDFYLGIGYKASTKNSSEARDYSQEMLSYAYSGFLYRMGLKVGYQIR